MAALTKVKIVGMTLAKRQRRVQIVELVVKEDGMKSGLLPRDYFLAPYYLLFFILVDFMYYGLIKFNKLYN